MKKTLGVVIAATLLAGVCYAESKYATGGLNATITVGPGRGPTYIKAIDAKADFSVGSVMPTIDIWARSGSKQYPTAVQGASVNIAIANTNSVIGAGTNVFIVYATGAVDYRTLSAQNATNITVTAASSAALTSGSYVIPAVQDYIIHPVNVEILDAATTNIYYTSAGSVVYESPAESPLYIKLNGTNSVLGVTVSK